VTGVELPVFCDECPVLAVAEFDDRVLCLDCLMAALASCAPAEIESHVRPLVTTETGPPAS
jgi:hypothetical protein